MNWLLLKNSLLVAGLTTVVAVSFGFLASLWLAALPARWRNFFLVIAIMTLALPPFLVTNCWLHFLGYTGVWHACLPFNIVSLGGTIWILSLLTWPITLFAVSSAWTRLEPSQLESDPAVAGWAVIRGLLWPLSRNALAQAAVLTFVLALNNFAVPAILQVKVFPAEIWVRFNTTFDTLGALRLSWPLIVAPLLLLLWLSRRELLWPRAEGPVSAKLFRQQLGVPWFWLSGAGTVILCVLALGLPLFQLISVKRTWTELPGALAAGQLALWNSFSLAAASATAIVAVALAVGSPSGGRSARSNSCNLCNSYNLFTSFLWLPFLLPGVLLGIGLIAVFNRSPFSIFYQSAGIVILAFVMRYLALGWNAVGHAFQTFDPDLTDAARLNGATRWQMLRHVYWPQISPHIAAAWYVVFLLCLWDVESVILVVPPGGETLALRVFNLLHYGHNAQVNALCLTLLALAVAPLLIWQAYRMARTACHRNTHHVSRFTFHVSCILSASAILLLASCSTKPASNEVPIQSQLFSRVQIIGSRGVGVGQLNKPRSVAVDTQDNLYVVDMTGRVQKFSSNGLFLLSWQMPQTDKGKPKGMCRDRDGNIVVLEPHYQRVNHFSPEGKLVAQWGEHGTNAGQFTLPRAVAVNSRGEIFVSEYEGVERVQKFSPGRGADALVRANLSSPLADGEAATREPDRAPAFQLLNSFGHAGNAPGELNRPEGLCVDAQDRVYVADSCNHRIQVFSSEGKFIRAYGKAGSGQGELSYPYDICVDGAGRQYVCEFGNSRIQVFDANDRPIEIIGGPGAQPGRFSNPWGVALDSAGNLYVADSQNHRVQKFIRK
jgi:ABC-type Fe3+ transport system permease subunit/DNA-binding beta-propeller fold protein YncE